jgi:hypothetical protein
VHKNASRRRHNRRLSRDRKEKNEKIGRGILLGKREPEAEEAPLRRLFTVESTGLVAEAIDKSLRRSLGAPLPQPRSARYAAPLAGTVELSTRRVVVDILYRRRVDDDPSLRSVRGVGAHGNIGQVVTESLQAVERLVLGFSRGPWSSSFLPR